MNRPWKDNRYTLIQWTCSYHKRRYRIRKTASMQWYNPRLWSYRKTWRNVTHPSDVSASRCRGSLVLATADRNRRLPLCWRAPSCRQKYRKTWRNVTRPIPPTCLPHGVAAACFVLATADKKAETHNHLSIHQWVRSAIFAPQQHASPIGFLFLKLPPPPCAVLLVWSSHSKFHLSWAVPWKQQQLGRTLRSVPFVECHAQWWTHKQAHCGEVPRIFLGANVVVIYRIVELDFQIMYFMFVIEKRSNMHM